MLVILICLCFGICNSWWIPCLFTVFKHFHLKKRKEKRTKYVATQQRPNSWAFNSAQSSLHTFALFCFQFVCEEGSGDYIARVDEPQSCRYVLTIHTSRTCQHPFLRPPSTAKPQSIVCQPALSAQQYMDYVKAQVCEWIKKTLKGKAMHLGGLLIFFFRILKQIVVFLIKIPAKKLTWLSNFKLALSFVLWLIPLPIILFPFPADTKRKVEQISEELRSLDEMLAGNEGGDGAVKVTAEETSPSSRRKGEFFWCLWGKRPRSSNLSVHLIIKCRSIHNGRLCINSDSDTSVYFWVWNRSCWCI